MTRSFAEGLLLEIHGLNARSVDLLLLFSFALKPSIISAGKVWPFSHMSTSFLILSCFRQSTSKFLFDGVMGSARKPVITRSWVASLRLCEQSQVCLLQGDGNVKTSTVITKKNIPFDPEELMRQCQSSRLA